MDQQDKKRRRLKLILIIELVILIVLSLVLAGYLYVQSVWNKIQHVDLGEDIKINKEIETSDNHLKGYMNIALFGIDTNGAFEKGARSDSIIIVSINNDTKDIILTSVYRDTFLDTTEGEYRKATEVYALGGPAQAVNMLNVNLDLDITQFVAIDWNGLIDVINLMGGIEVEINEEEAHVINLMLKDTARDSNAPIKSVDSTGLTLLDGVQATTFARIRAIDNDYNRSERQRKVLEGVFNKAKTMDILTLNKIANEALPKVATNIRFGDGLAFLKNMASYQLKETYGFPFEKGSGFNNSQWILYADDLQSNVEELHKRLYGKPYQASSTVVSISNEIKALVGGISTQPPIDAPQDLYEYNQESVNQPTFQNEPQSYEQPVYEPPVVEDQVVQPQPIQEQPESPIENNVSEQPVAPVEVAPSVEESGQ